MNVNTIYENYKEDNIVILRSIQFYNAYIFNTIIETVESLTILS